MNENIQKLDLPSTVAMQIAVFSCKRPPLPEMEGGAIYLPCFAAPSRLFCGSKEAKFYACTKGSLSSEEHHEMEENHETITALQKHVLFFDRNNDGIIFPSETFQGFRAIGCGLLLSSVAAGFIHLGLSRKTRPGKPFSLSFPIEVKNIKWGKHGSDSGVYDKQGRFVMEKFEEIFEKHARSNSDALTWDELDGFMKSKREPKDYGGWLAGFTEWKILYILCKDHNGLLHKDKVRGAYDGTLFEEMEMEIASSKKKP